MHLPSSPIPVPDAVAMPKNTHNRFDFGFVAVAISIVFSAPNRSLLLFIGSVSLPAHISLISLRELVRITPAYHLYKVAYSVRNVDTECAFSSFYHMSCNG